jgi:hypothetical protein
MRAVGWMVGCAALALGCGGSRHLGKHFGESVTKAFAAQQQRGKAPPAEAVAGLDAQEAAITTDNYRAGLAPPGGEVKTEPTILVAPPSREQPMRLAPSVPTKE